MPGTRARLMLKTTSLQREFAIDLEVTIGRDRGCEVVIDSERVAPRQARIYFDESTGGFFIESLGAGTTWVDGAPLRGPQRLGAMSVITLGGAVDLVFQRVERAAARPPVAPATPPQPEKPAPGGSAQPAAPTAPPASSGPAPAPPAPPPAAPPAPKAPPTGDDLSRTEIEPFEPIVMSPDQTEPEGFAPMTLDENRTEVDPFEPGGAPDTPRAPRKRLQVEVTGPAEVVGTHDLEEGETMLGSTPTCGIQIAHWSVSRKHALIHVKDGVCRVKDLGSTNGTYFRGDRIDAEVEWTEGASVNFGKVVARLSTRSR